jgi:hypothetical protein
MTPEQIALIKYAIRAENKKTAKVLGKLKVPVDDYESPLAKALRSALALAEQARAMEGWEVQLAYKGDRYAIENSEGVYTVDYQQPGDGVFLFLAADGTLADEARKRAKFPTLHTALAAANAAMKAGEA